MSLRNEQGGAALILVVWMIAALSVMVAGAVSISKVEADQTNRLLLEAKIFSLGRGLAALVLLDRATHLEASGLLISEGELVDQGSGESAGEAVFQATYMVDGWEVKAAVYPKSGFVSIAEKNWEVWAILLRTLGGLDETMATALAENIVASDVSASVGGFVGSFAAVRRNMIQASGFVEQLLSVDGMTREVYDRVKRSVSPFAAEGVPDAASAPPELVASFADAVSVENPLITAEVSNSAEGDFCVEFLVTGIGDGGLSQRVWVKNFSSSDQSAMQLIRAERAASHYWTQGS